MRAGFVGAWLLAGSVFGCGQAPSVADDTAETDDETGESTDGDEPCEALEGEATDRTLWVHESDPIEGHTSRFAIGPDGTIFFTTTVVTETETEIRLVAHSPDAEVLWSRKIESEEPSFVKQITVAPSGQIVLGGASDYIPQRTAWLRVLDPEGTTLATDTLEVLEDTTTVDLLVRTGGEEVVWMGLSSAYDEGSPIPHWVSWLATRSLDPDADAQLVWQNSISEPDFTRVENLGDGVVIGGIDDPPQGLVVALDANWSERWQAELWPEITGTPFLASHPDGGVVTANTAHNEERTRAWGVVTYLEPDGTTRWRHELAYCADSWHSGLAVDNESGLVLVVREVGDERHDFVRPTVSWVDAFDVDGELQWSEAIRFDDAREWDPDSGLFGPDGEFTLPGWHKSEAGDVRYFFARMQVD